MSKRPEGDWVENSGRPSIRSRFVKQVIRTYVNRSINARLEQVRTAWEKQAERLKVPAGFEIRSESIAGVECEWILPDTAAGKKTIVYLHGGGYVLGSLKTARSFALSLSRYTGERVLSVGYRLAPENPFPAGLEDSLTVYRSLLEKAENPEEIILIGDSAGGGLSLATVLALKEKEEALPHAVVCLSPWTDLAATGESNTSNAKMDPIFGKGGGVIKAEDYAGGESLYNPLISPLYGDYSGFPPLFIHVGTDEVILDDSVRLAEKAREAGVDVSLKIWNGMWHVFTSLDKVVPEAKQSFKEIAEFIKGTVHHFSA
ncbi:MAG: alpha/beta hydrolase [Bacillota bacterium]|nr:alpha/beta hydrolase [Bacillota bacterium]